MRAHTSAGLCHVDNIQNDDDRENENFIQRKSYFHLIPIRKSIRNKITVFTRERDF